MYEKNIASHSHCSLILTNRPHFRQIVIGCSVDSEFPCPVWLAYVALGIVINGYSPL
jgi:hypothetical protein